MSPAGGGRPSPGRQDAELHLRRVLHEQLARLDLCSRSEFDAQQRVLERLQQRLVELEARVVALEQRAQPSAAATSGAAIVPPGS